MKKLLSLLPVLALMMAPQSGLAAKGGEKGPADAAFEHASDKASFKRDKDWKEDKKKDKEDRKEEKSRDKDDRDDDKEESKEVKADKDQRKTEKKAIKNNKKKK